MSSARGLFALLLVSTMGMAQSTTGEKASPWLIRAEAITDTIQRESSQLSRANQWILPLRLAEIWRRADPQRARAWAADVAERMSATPIQESEQDREARFSAMSKLLPAMNRIDRVAADRLLDAVTKRVGQITASAQTEAEKRQLRDSLMRMADDSADSDPARALSLLRQLIQLRVENSYDNFFSSAYDALRRSDPDAARQAAREALTLALRDGDRNLLWGLIEVAWPSQPPVPDTTPPDEGLRKEFIQGFLASVARPATSPEDQAKICSLLLSAARIVDKFPEEQQQSVRLAINGCTASQRHFGDALQQVTFSHATAEQLTAQAADGGDAGKRAFLKQTAAMNALVGNDFARALAILDSFSAEEREASGSWRRLRERAVEQHIRSLIRTREFPAALRMIESAPETSQPGLLLELADRAFTAKDRAFGMAVLAQARRWLEEHPVSDNFVLYLNLVRLYARESPEDAPGALLVMVRGINNPGKRDDPTMIRTPLGADLEPAPFAAALVDPDAGIVDAAIADIKSPEARTAFRLSLLQACLRRQLQGVPVRPSPQP